MSFFRGSILFLVLFMLACSGGTNQKSEAKVEVSEQVAENMVSFNIETQNDSTVNNPIGSRSMGKAKSGEQLSDNFALKNCTDKAIVILSAKSNCGCLKVEYDKSPIKAGEKKVMSYSYDSRGKMGQQFSEVTIKTNIGSYIVLVDLLVE